MCSQYYYGKNGFRLSLILLLEEDNQQKSEVGHVKGKKNKNENWEDEKEIIKKKKTHTQQQKGQLDIPKRREETKKNKKAHRPTVWYTTSRD